MRSTTPPSRKAGQFGPLSGHAARITDLRTLSRRRCRAPLPLRRGHPRRLRSRRGGGWLVLGSWGLGGDELAGVRVDVVEVVVVVVVVVVGVVRRHLLDAGGDATHRLHVRLRGRPAPRPPPFGQPSPPGSHALSRLSLGARGALALALGPFPAPCPCRGSRPPSPTPWPVRSPTAPRPAPWTWAPCPRPCAPFPCPGPFPAPCPQSRCPLPALCPPPAAAPLLPAARALACSLRALLGTSPVASCPPLRAPVAGTQLCLRALPSFLDHASGVPLSLQLRQRDARRRALGRRGADVPCPPRGEGLRGELLRGAGVGVGGVGVGAVLRALPAHCCCCGGRRRGARGPCGVRPPLSRRAGGRGVAGRGGGAARRGRGCNPSRALLALLCGCGSPRRCARFLRRGYPPCRRGAGGRGRGSLGLRSPLPVRLGPPPAAGAAGLAAPASVAVTSAGSGSRASGGGPTSTTCLRQPPLLALREGLPRPLRGGGGAGAAPAVWRSSRWGDPSESAITVILVGMRGGRRALPTTSWCISAVPWAVPCGALRGGGGEGVGGRLWRQPRTAGGRRPSIGIERGGGGATRPTRRATAPSLGRGPGFWAPGGRRVVSGGAALGGPP